jgi:glycerol-3-phosphate dehydrogenase
VWAQIHTTPEWDVIVIGGGITGAGILREAARAGLRALLVEQRDFAWGTSSRSSKLVHGGLRYLKQGQISMTYQSVRERQHLLATGDGLVTRLGFLMPMYEHGGSKLPYQIGLSVYDLMARQWGHRQYKPDEFAMLAPHISREGLEAGFYYEDAQTDDARLVLRVLQEAIADGGAALNYVEAKRLIKNQNGVCGVELRDVESGQTVNASAHVVINATGAWVDRLREQVGGDKKIRPLRGSHLVFPSWRFPVAQAVNFAHPHDGRYISVIPWEEITLIGTTDVDHDGDLNIEPRISGEEVAYLLAAANSQFPTLELTLDDILSTYSGVRPVIGTGKVDPSKESRDHVVWLEEGLLSVTGGKLTTFRAIALDALKAAQPRLPEFTRVFEDAPALDPVQDNLPPEADNLMKADRTRLLGRYGSSAADLARLAQSDELCRVPNTRTLWAELRWAAHAEALVHLDDLLLRRTRLGLVLPEGGIGHIERIREICEPKLGWGDERWNDEIARYQSLWRERYSLPSRAEIPDWHDFLGDPQAEQPSSKGIRWSLVLAAALMVIGLLWLLRKRD